MIEDRFEHLPSFENVIIKNPGLDVDDSAFRSTVEPLVEELRGLDGVLARIHRRTALGTALEEARGCSSESGIMVLEQIAVSVPLFTLDIGRTPVLKFFDWEGAVEDGGKIGITANGVVLTAEHFTLGQGSAGLLVIVDPGEGSTVDTPAIQAATANLIAAVQQDDQFGEPIETIVNIEGDLLGITVPLSDIEDMSKDKAAVEKLRELAPLAFVGADVDVFVGGWPAETLDSEDNMKDKAPLVFGFVLILAFLLLLVMFRPIIIPIKAIILDLLSVGAAYGVLVLVFQEGVGEGPLNFEAAGSIEIFMPLFLFALLFGLSMDYHMLVLSRIKEAYDAGSSNEASVSLGIKATAALVMVLVFAAFATARMMFFKQIGVGLGVAILIDATLIRAVLLPARMKLLGDLNWYLPKWLEWLPRVSAEGDNAVSVSDGSTDGEDKRHSRLAGTEGQKHLPFFAYVRQIGRPRYEFGPTLFWPFDW